MKHFIVKIFFCTVLVVACQSKHELTTNQPEGSDVPDQEGWNSTITSTSDGMITSKIKYVHMQKYSNRKKIKFDQGVELDFYDSNGVHTSKIYAAEAELADGKRNLDLWGNVRVLSDNGFKLYSEKIHWREYSGKILTDEYVTIITAENDTINGVGFESDNSLKNWTIKKPSGITQSSLDLQDMESPTNESSKDKK